jgi:hypothetical protein
MKGDFTRQTFDRYKHYSGVRMQQGRVQLDADWNEQRDIDAHHAQTVHHDVIGRCGAPLHDAGFFIQPQGGNLLIGAGRYYVHGILCENDADILYTAQPDFPGATLPPSDGPGLYIAYVDVWQHHVTALEDPDIREVALGGPDSTTRTKSIWQVKLLRVADLGASLTCLSEPEAWLAEVAPSTGQMQARSQPGGDATNVCIIPPGAGYRRLENQLYRVEIHQRGALGVSTFKWSRDNGSIVTAWLDQDGDDLIVSSLGRDKTLSFANGQWVELTDDTRELNGEPGTLVRLTNAEGQILTIDPTTATGTVNRADFPSNPKVRRWDMPDGPITVAIPVDNDGWVPLEDGVEVRFQAGSFETGDYWLIPARTLTGDVEWPHDASSPPQPLTQLPHGIRHHYCRLALLNFSQDIWTAVDDGDCRLLFPPMTELRSLFYVGGDGQEVAPDPTQPTQLLPLPQSLQVGVANGTHRVADATVRFTVRVGGGSLQGNLATVDIDTVDGIATCNWSLDSTTPSQQVEASLLDVDGTPVHVPIRFTANLSLASEVAYDPRNCADLTAAGVRTVQQAIDELCRRTPEEEPGIGIRRIESMADGEVVLNDVIVPVSRLAAGLLIDCDARLSEESGGSVPSEPQSSYGPDTVPAKPTCFVTLDLPYPLGAERELWQFGGVAGFQPLIVASTVVIRENLIAWRPTEAASVWLLQHLFQRLNIQEVTDRILAHLTIKGNFIWHGESGEEPAIYLDGEAFGRPSRDGRVDIRLPSGNGRRGGDFEMWFWLMRSEQPGLVIDVTVAGNTMAGVVRESTGSVTPGATVTLTGPGGTRTALTDAQGGFRFASLTPGTYVVTAQLGDLSAQRQVIVPGISGPPIPPPPLPPVFDPRAFPGRTLAEVGGVGPSFRARLEENGITHPAELASLEAARLAEILRISESRASTIRENARRLLSG